MSLSRNFEEVVIFSNYKEEKVMCIKPIRTLQDFQRATQHAVFLADEMWPNFTVLDKDEDRSDEFEVLTVLMEIYKKENWSFHYADPIQTIKHHMREWGLKLIDFADITGSIELSESILNKTQPLTLKEVWKLYKEWKIPVRLLLHPYPLKIEKQRKMKPFNLN